MTRHAAAVILIAALCGAACSKPIDHEKLVGLAAELTSNGSMTLILCRTKYDLYFAKMNRAKNADRPDRPDCDTEPVTTAERKLRWALRDAGLSDQPAKDYLAAFETAMKNLDAGVGESEIGYTARQASSGDRLNAAAVTLASAVR